MIMRVNDGFRFRMVAVLALVALVVPTSAFAARAIPDNNLAYPVLISLPEGKGSGFFLSREKDIHLVTAAHVLFQKGTNKLKAATAVLTAQSGDPDDPSTTRLKLDLKALAAAKAIRKHRDHDVAIVHIANATSRQGQGGSALEGRVAFVPGITTLESSSLGIIGISTKNTKPLAEVLIANEVFIFGYPTSLGLKAIPQVDFTRPLLRRGIVAGKNTESETLILDCAVYPGNSGGPVVEVERKGLVSEFRLVGVLSQFVPFAETWVNQTHGYKNSTITNSGYSVAVGIDAVLELLP